MARPDGATPKKEPHSAATPQKPSVRTPHPRYTEYAAKWKRMRDVVGGQDAVHAAGEAYLPRLHEQLAPEYNAYKARATFFNATWRTVSGLQGMLFRRAPKVKVPASVEPLLEDVDLAGTPFHVLLLKVTEEDLTTGRIGVLVDYPAVNVHGLTQADAKRLDLRPTMATYKAEAIINWKRKQVGNRTVLGQVRLQEVVRQEAGEFGETCETRYRVLDLVTARDTTTGAAQEVYRVRVFRIDEKGEDQQVGQDAFPLMNGKPLDYVPFYFIGVDDTSEEVDCPPLEDLANVNLAHYRVTADYEHGCHFTGLPTPWVAGYTKKDGESLYVGSTTAWVFPNAEAKAGYMEFTGQGLTALKENLAAKEQLMAVLGARMLEPQKREVETAEVAATHRAGENCLLGSMAQAISLGMHRALVTFCRWAGAAVEDGSDAVELELNRDFFPTPMDAPTLTALVAAWQAGALSDEELFAKLQEREVIAKDKTLEEHQTEVENSSAAKPAAGEALPLEDDETADPPQPGEKPAPKPAGQRPLKAA